MTTHTVSDEVALNRSPAEAWYALRDYFPGPSRNSLAYLDYAAENNDALPQSIVEIELGKRIRSLIQPSGKSFEKGFLEYHIQASATGSILAVSLTHDAFRPFLRSPKSWYEAKKLVKTTIRALQSYIESMPPSACAPSEEGNAFPLHIPLLDNPLSMLVHMTKQDLFVSTEIRENGIWEEYETEVLLKLLKPGDVFLDVGANIGYYTVISSVVVGDSGKVFAFEPDPDNFALLERNANLNGLHNTCLVNAALSFTSSAGALYLNPENCGDHQVYDPDGNRDHVPIQLLHGSEFLEQHVSSVNFIKIDTQGAEVEVLRGLLPLIQKTLPSLSMITEFWPFGLARSGHTGEALLELLLEAGFDTFIVVEHGERALLRTNPEELRIWLKFTERDPTNTGFINLLCTTQSQSIPEITEGGFFPRKPENNAA